MGGRPAGGPRLGRTAGAPAGPPERAAIPGATGRLEPPGPPGTAGRIGGRTAPAGGAPGAAGRTVGGVAGLGATRGFTVGADFAASPPPAPRATSAPRT